VPYVGNAYMMSRKLLDDPDRKPSFIHKLLEPDMALCSNLREKVGHSDSIFSVCIIETTVYAYGS